MNLYSVFGAPILKLLPADLAHAVGERAMRLPLWSLVNTYYDSRLCLDVAGVKLLNPVMGAAGLDKNCHFAKNLLRSGFGGVVIGTVTPHKRTGNAKPRIVRLPATNALANSMGFPNDGVVAISARLHKLANERCQIVVSIADETIDGFLAVYRAVAPHCAGVELNISSPNTSGLKRFHDHTALKELLSAVMGIAKKRAVFVKLPRLTNRADILSLSSVVADSTASGVILTNSKPVENTKLAIGRGGMSGMPLYADTLQIVKDTRTKFGADLGVIGCGGVSSAKQVWELLASGANAVQLYSALVYEGPLAPNKINRDLTRALERANLNNISEVKDGIGWPLTA